MGIRISKNEVLAAVCLASGGVWATSASAAIVIDDFSNYMMPVVSPASPGIANWNTWSILPTYSNPVTYTETGLSAVFGDVRKTRLTRDTNAMGGLEGMLIAGIPDRGENRFSIETGSLPPWTVDFTYDAGGAWLNLDASSGSKFSVDFDPDQLLPGASLAITLVSHKEGPGNTSTVVQTWASPISPAPRMTVDFRFTQFSGLDFSDIDSIKLTYTGTAGNDVDIYSLTTNVVPEPASLNFLGLGAVGLLSKRRRKA